MEITSDNIQSLLDEPGTITQLIIRLNKFSFENRNTNPHLSNEAALKALELATGADDKKGKAQSLLNLGFYNMHVANQEKAFSCLYNALALFEEMNDQEGIATSQYNMGIVYLRAGNFNSAVDFLHKCLAYREKANDKAGIAACLFQLSYIHRHFDHMTEARDAAERSLAIRTELKDESGIAASLMVLGEVYLRERNFEKAREILGKSLAIREKSSEKLGYFASLLGWTELHKELEDYDKAVELAALGFSMAKEENIGLGIVRFKHMQGKIHLKRQSAEEAKVCLLEALEFADRFAFKSIMYEIHASLAGIYKNEGNFEAALSHYEKFHVKKEEVISLQSNTQLKSMQLISEMEFARKEAEIEKVKNSELNEANAIISHKNKEITDSINYARRIQTGILPSEAELKSCLGDHFVLYLPKDIVSGDFYWCTQTRSSITNEKLSIVAAIDCTGHGVPGAFMSMLGRTLLNQTIKNPDINSPADVLDFLNHELPRNLQSHHAETMIRDGMDMALCAINFKALQLHYAGANNPLWIFRDGGITEIKADKQAISAGNDLSKQPFTNHKIKLKKDDIIYIFTDGYADQFGGPKGKKLKYGPFADLIKASAALPMQAQCEKLKQHFLEWKGRLEQVDDVCLIGIRI